MSCNEWERGSFRLSTKEFPKFRKAFIQKWNEALTRDFEQLNKVFAALKAAGKGQRKFDWDKALRELLQKTTGGDSMWSPTRNVYPFDILDDYAIERKLLQKRVEKVDARGNKRISYEACPPRTPKKSEMGFLKSNTDGVSQEEAVVRFEPKTRTIHWNVSENNHACDAAHENFIGDLFFGLLGKVEWTRGTGGHIFGNDEYHEEGGHEGAGGGASYIKQRFGPLGEKAGEPRRFPRPRRAPARQAAIKS